MAACRSTALYTLSTVIINNVCFGSEYCLRSIDGHDIINVAQQMAKDIPILIGAITAIVPQLC